MAEEMLGTDHDEEETDLPTLNVKGKGKRTAREISESRSKKHINSQVLVLSDTADEEVMEPPRMKKVKTPPADENHIGMALNDVLK